MSRHGRETEVTRPELSGYHPAQATRLMAELPRGQASLEGYRMLMCVHTCVREKICMYISTYIHSSHNDPVR